MSLNTKMIVFVQATFILLNVYHNTTNDAIYIFKIKSRSISHHYQMFHTVNLYQSYKIIP